MNNDYTHWEMYAIGGSANPTINSQGNRFAAPDDRFSKEVNIYPFEKKEISTLFFSLFLFQYCFFLHGNLNDKKVIWCEPINAGDQT